MTDFLNKRVAVLGAGTENMPLVSWLVKQGARVVVCDQKRQEELPTLKELARLPVEFRLGPHYLDHLEDFEVVFRTPFLPTWHPRLVAARRRKVIVSSQTNLFFERCPCPIIGVTGTKGKGTTVSLIFEMLRAGHFDVYLGGNIGTPPITFLDTLTPESWVVLELSSFQLEDLERSPQIAVVLGITPDHLDRHRTFLEYLEAKKQIVRHQRKGDAAVLAADYVTTMECAVATPAEVYLVSTKKKVEQGAYVKDETVILVGEDGEVPVVSLTETHLLGRHNLENIGAAAVAARLAGADIESIRKGVRTFPGQPHTLELVAEIDGVRYVDDSHATTPTPTIAAIKSFTAPLILIVGGSSKKVSYRELGETIARHSTVKHVILLGTAEAPKIRAAIEAAMDRRQHVPDFYPVSSMEAAVETATRLARPGDVVLLSPAAASFDLFANYKERGDAFKRAVAMYAKA